MSQSLCDVVKAPAIQDVLDNQFSTAQNMRPTATPLLSYVMTEENRSAFRIDQAISSNTGKLRSVEIIYDQPMLETDITAMVDACSADRELCDFTKTYDFTATPYGSQFKLGVGTLSESIEVNSSRISREVARMIEGIKQYYSEQLAIWAAANAGAWSQDTATIDGTNVTVANVLQVNTTLANGTNARIPNAVLFEQINRALEMSRFTQAGIFGANDLVSFLRRALAGGQNTILGYDIREMLAQFGVGMQYDRHVAAAVAGLNNTSTNLAVMRGAIAPVGFALYESDNAKIQQADSVADVIYDPETGMKFDFRMTRPCDEWVISLSANYQFFGLPTNLYQVGSNWEGVTGIGLVGVTCDDLTPCQD